MGAFDHLEWTYDGAFEQLFGLGRGEFEQKFSKNSNARGGMLKLRFDWYIKSTFGFSYVLFVTVVTLYHVDNVFGVAVNVMINKSSFAGRIKCILSKSAVYVIAR